MRKVLYTEYVDPIGPSMLEQSGFKVVMANRNENIIKNELLDSDAVVTRIYEFPIPLLEKSTKLKLISKHGVGYDNIPVEWCKTHNIAVTITPGANSQSVAEHTIMLAMALSKNLAVVTKGYREKGFAAKNTPPGMELLDKTMGIIGIGHIGSKVAKMAIGIGMKVVAYDPYVQNIPDGVQLLKNKNDVIRQADVLTLHPVLNKETRCIIGAREFALMKQGSYFINCGRGPLIDEEALIANLKNKHLGGAGLDVTAEEPCNPESPLFAMDNVLLTPHYAPTTHESSVNVSRAAAQNIIDVFDGKKPEGLL